MADVEHEGGLSRRGLLTGLGAAGAVGALAGLHASPVEAAAARSIAAFPQVIGPITPGLTYFQIDAVGFSTALNDRYFDDTSGTGDLTPPGQLLAPLLIPAGSVIRQINLAYLGTPTVQIWRRYLNSPQLGSPNGPQAFINQTMPLGNNPGRAEPVTSGLPLTIEDGATYSIRISEAAGTSVFGMTVGYEPPKQGFVPIAPPTRPLDTRQPGQGGKLNVDEERTINLGLPAGSRGAVINLTITETEGSFGFVSVFAADIAFPGNSSINWSSAGQTSANAVITDVDGSGRIKIRGSVNRTQVIIDVLGSFQ